MHRKIKWTLAKVLRQSRDPLSLASWLEEAGVLHFPVKCEGCEKALGKPCVVTSRGKSRVVVRCSKKSCRRNHSILEGSVFDGMTLSLDRCELLLYLWSVKTPFESLATMTGLANDTISFFQMRLRDRMRIEVEKTKVGGQHHVVEIDETEYGKKRKGLHGHPSVIKINVWGRCAGTPENWLWSRSRRSRTRMLL